MTSLWYRTSEQPLRAGIWFCGNSLSLLIGNSIAVGILEIKSKLGAWQVRVERKNKTLPYKDNLR